MINLKDTHPQNTPTSFILIPHLRDFDKERRSYDQKKFKMEEGEWLTDLDREERENWLINVFWTTNLLYIVFWFWK